MPLITLVLPGTIRIKKNSKRIFKRKKYATVLPSLAYLEWEKQARNVAWENPIVPPLTCQVEVTAVFYYKGHRPDLSGAMESLGDCLEGIIWADDTQIESWDGSRMVHDLENPRTVVVVRW